MSGEDGAGAGAAADMAKEDTVYESAAAIFASATQFNYFSIILSERSNHHSILIVPIAILIGID
jgi:hypothetical protein